MKETDWISRQAAIDAIDGVLMEDEQYKVWLKIAIKNVPSAQQWILCKDSQPKEEGEYLVWWSNAYTSARDVAVWDGENWWTADTMSLCMTAEVDAWCELPEPYEGVEE